MPHLEKVHQRVGGCGPIAQFQSRIANALRNDEGHLVTRPGVELAGRKDKHRAGFRFTRLDDVELALRAEGQRIYRGRGRECNERYKEERLPHPISQLRLSSIPSACLSGVE